MNHTPSDTDHPDSTPDTDTTASEYPTTVEDPSTGARITFLERGVDDRGPYLLVDGVLPPGTDGGPARLHPRSEARSEVVEGRAVVTVGGEEMVLLPGESVIIGAGDPHTIRNGDEGPLVVRTTQTTRRVRGRDPGTLRPRCWWPTGPTRGRCSAVSPPRGRPTGGRSLASPAPDPAGPRSRCPGAGACPGVGNPLRVHPRLSGRLSILVCRRAHRS